MRDHARVARKQLRTKDYSEEARHRLGEAVESARIQAGYKSRPKFCEAHGIKNLRGLELLEGGRTGVGQAFLFEVADALPGWTHDTPRVILEGGPIPSNDSLPTRPETQQPIIAVYNEEERTFAETLADLDFTVDEINEHLELRRARIQKQSGMDVGQAGESSA